MAKSTKEFTAENTVAAVEVATTVAPAAVPAQDEEHCYVYLGPTKSGLIQSGTIYKAKSKDDIPEIKLALEKIPQIKMLITLDKDIRAIKDKLSKGNNAVSNAFKAIAEAKI